MTALRSETIEMPPVKGSLVLAVDDEPWVRMRLEGFLREAGVAFEMCSDPYEALERYKARPSDYGLILMDIRFPTGDLGFEVSKEIAEFSENTKCPPIIGMSGYPNLYRFNGGAECGMVDILPKPLFKWLVINLVREYCMPEAPEQQI